MMKALVVDKLTAGEVNTSFQVLWPAKITIATSELYRNITHIAMASALVWELTKNHNSFLHKRERTSRLGAVAFTTEPGNLLNVNSYKYSGLANDKTVGISADLTLSTKVC